MGTVYFLRALSVIHQTSSRLSRASRIRRIRRAAYASMAFSTNSRRVWRRALLFKLQTRTRINFSGGCRRRSIVVPRRIRVSRPSDQQADQTQVLRQLVPGGAAMDYCKLLEETADYIKCLNMQVGLMKTIANSIP